MYRNKRSNLVFINKIQNRLACLKLIRLFLFIFKELKFEICNFAQD